MRVLLVDGDPTTGDLVALELHDSGHDVVRCFGRDDEHLCRGVAAHDECPVDATRIDAAVLVRAEGATPSLREMPAICAIRHRIPVVEASPGDAPPFGGWVTPGGDSVLTALSQAVTGDRGGHVAAVEAVLVSVPAVVRLGRLPGVHVRRDGTRLVLTLVLPHDMSDDDVNAIVTWAVRGLRDHDPYASVVDVAIERHD
jgi:hypothetical protein